LAQEPQEEFATDLITACQEKNVSKVQDLINEHRLWVKPVLNQLISEFIQRTMTGNRAAAGSRKTAAVLIAQTFQDSYGEKNLSIATGYLDSWTMEQMGKKAQADRIFGIAEDFRTNSQQIEEAVTEYHRALELYLDIGDVRGEGEVFGRLGLIYWSIDSDTCLAFYQKALVARERVDDKFLVGATLNSLGVVYLSKYGELDSAILYLERARRVRQETGDLTGLGNSLVYLALSYDYNGQYVKAQDAYLEAFEVNEKVGNKVKMAEAMRKSAQILNGTGHYQEALLYLKVALELREELNDPVKVGNVLNDQGNVYTNMRNYDKAIELYAKTAEIMNTEGNLEGQANAFNNIGTILDEVGRYQKAIEYYTRSMDICKETGDREGTGTALGNLGNSYYGLGRFKEAEHFQYQALKISRELSLHDNEIHNLINLSNAQNALGKLDSALHFCNQALEKAVELNNPRLVWVATFNQGDNFEKRGDYQKAIERYEQALIIVEEIRLSLTGEEYRTKYMAAERFAFEGLIHLLGRLHLNEPGKGFDRKAFLYAERSKSRAFLDLLSDSIQPATLQEVQQSISGGESVILEYFLGDSSSSLWVITEEEHAMFVLPGREALTDDIETFRFSLSQPDPSNLQFFSKSAQSLYKQLMEPAAPYLKKKKKLVIIPDGELFYLPFEALLTKAPKKGKSSDPSAFPYLLVKHQLAYGHSATILMNMPAGMQIDGDKKPSLLAFGDPEFSTQYKRLGYSAEEVKNIASHFESGKADVFVQKEASEQRIKNIPLDRYNYIHFATHGTVDEVIPDFSSLVLSEDPERNEDGFLQAWEIMDLKLNADLVVLSACETGLGKLVRGEGLVGLTQSLVYSGASSVLVSLWSVADQSTSGFMTEFYKHLITENQEISLSLQETKLSMIESADLAHPFYWAPFVLIGDWR
jgi:CHAT domain-containing protein